MIHYWLLWYLLLFGNYQIVKLSIFKIYIWTIVTTIFLSICKTYTFCLFCWNICVRRPFRINKLFNNNWYNHIRRAFDIQRTSSSFVGDLRQVYGWIELTIAHRKINTIRRVYITCNFILCVNLTATNLWMRPTCATSRCRISIWRSTSCDGANESRRSLPFNRYTSTRPATEHHAVYCYLEPFSQLDIVRSAGKLGG